MYIKRGIGTGYIQELLKILKVLVLCGDTIYVKALGRVIMILLHQRRMATVTSWAHLTEVNFNLLNEEIGEISLSVLQRAMLRSSSRRDIKTVSEKYAGVRTVVDNMSTQLSSLSSRFARDRGSKRRRLTIDSKEAIRMREYFTLTLEMLRMNECPVYASAKSYPGRDAAAADSTKEVVVKHRYGRAHRRLKLLMGREQKAWLKYLREKAGGEPSVDDEIHPMAEPVDHELSTSGTALSTPTLILRSIRRIGIIVI